MPHIIVDGCDTNRQIQQINIHAEIVFSRQTWITPRARVKMEELKQKLEELITVSAWRSGGHLKNCQPTTEAD